MLKSLGTEFKVGLFTLVALITLGYMFVMLGSDLMDSTEYKNYTTILRDAAGIIPKTHVKTNGLTIGRVKDITLDRETFSTRATLEIDSKIEILSGSTLEIRTVGLLGDKFIEIVRSGQGVVIENGGYIPESTESVDMQTLIAMVGSIARDIKQVTSTLATVFGSKEGEASVSRIMQNVEGISDDLRRTAETVRRVIGERDTDLNEIVTNVTATVADLREFSTNLRQILDDENRDRVDSILARFDNSMEEVQGASAKIRLISEKLENGEGTIGRLLNNDDTINELEAAIKDIRKVLSPATKLQVGVDYHAEARFATETTAHYFNLKFQTRPDRWYLIGVVDPGVDYTEEVVTDVYQEDAREGATTRTREQIKEEKGLKFNAQIAKRWYDLALRFGLFESTGGFAADFFLFSDRLRLSAEAFDWNLKSLEKRRTAHLRAYSSILFFNHLTVLVGIDDPTRIDPNSCTTDVNCKVDRTPNWFFGAGLQFNDDDLKAMFGTAAIAIGSN